MNESTNEVILEYTAPSKEVVLELQQEGAVSGPVHLPIPAQSAEVQLKKEKKSTAIWITVAFIGVFILGIGIAAFISKVWILPALMEKTEQTDPQPPQKQEEGGNEAVDPGIIPSYGELVIEDDQEITIPTVTADKSVRMAIDRTHGALLSPQDIYKKVNPATVTVVCATRSSSSIGTGVIFTPDGYILTNAHVINGGISCRMILDNGIQYDCNLVGYDKGNDIAVLKAVNAKNLPTVTFGNSDDLIVGDTVYAIGNPLGMDLRGTMTDGIVSAVERSVTSGENTLTVMQTNAALNSGNSGGPLINCYGQVIGINTIKMSTTSTSTASIEGLGFALPTTSIAYMVNDLLTIGYSRGEPSFGMQVIIAPTTLPNGRIGLLVDSVSTGSAADIAGIRAGDYILEVDGKAVSSTVEVIHIRRTHAYGETISFLLYRDGKTIMTNLLLQ